uniref:Diphosphomevalonate decarboxylase-like N-terminal domain-containing protein n=1 Tax=Hippocampus comes TaxID=109280 RepID=A0A3Q2XTX1_HIPCM
VFPEKGSFKWKAPSNIALVKYWGKLENQIPANPSISFTLDAYCQTHHVNFRLIYFLKRNRKNPLSPKS